VKVWYLSVATVALQAVASFTLLMREFRRKLGVTRPAGRSADGTVLAAAATAEGIALAPDPERN
jgi:hypothetical protein